MKKILLIEDTPEILENFTEYLEMHGYEVHAADNGKDGVAFAAEISPDLIICDALMADMDGFEVLRLIKKSAKTAGIPFVFSTSMSENLEKSEALALGADDYLVKPFDLSKLLEVAEKWTVLT
ncbi:MAG: response regulator [Saprospiraceae bacterium]|jgi:DNA-binding response OmpR family regulator|nr:response regulator [Saprospiraceae bacterium]